MKGLKVLMQLRMITITSAPNPPVEVQRETPDGEHKDEDLNGPDRVR